MGSYRPGILARNRWPRMVSGSSTRRINGSAPLHVLQRHRPGRYKRRIEQDFLSRGSRSRAKIVSVRYDAAHIRPFGEGGEHEITNGLLLRADIHRLFDLGYVTVSNDGRSEVGRRLKEDFKNGRHYYAMHGQNILMPSHPEQRPRREALEWHQANRFLGGVSNSGTRDRGLEGQCERKGR